MSATGCVFVALLIQLSLFRSEKTTTHVCNDILGDKKKKG